MQKENIVQSLNIKYCKSKHIKKKLYGKIHTVFCLFLKW